MAHRPLADRGPRPLLLTCLLTAAAALGCDAAGSMASNPGPAVATGDQASIKVCNTLNSPIELGVGSVRLKAMPNQCMPAIGQTCTAIPSGDQDVKLWINGQEVWTQRAKILPGKYYSTKAAMDDMGKPTLVATTVTDAQVCAKDNPFGVTPPSNPGSNPPSATGASVGKFCHQLGRGNMRVELELVVGSVSFKATTGSCSIPLGQTCTALPTGNVKLELFADGTSISSTTATLKENKEYIFDLDLDAASKPVIVASEVKPDAKCSTFSPTENAGPEPQPTPPVDPNAPTVAKLCNTLPDGSGEAEATIGTQTFKAAPGQCSSPAGMMCTTIPIGMQRVVFKLAGKEVKVGNYNFPNGADVIFLGLIDPMTMLPDFQVGSPRPPATCASFVPTKPSTGGAGPAPGPGRP